MAIFKKPLLPCGTYVTRGGQVLDATPERLQRYARKFQEMKAQKIALPITWGHQQTGLPTPEADEAAAEFARSAYTAGKIIDMNYNPEDETLWFTGEAPGAEVDQAGNLLAWTRLPDGREVKSAVSEVSIGINRWTAGDGKVWNDIPVHVALCVLPVAHGTSGFQALSTAPKGHCSCPPGTRAVCGPTGCHCSPVPADAFNLVTETGPAEYFLSALWLAAERAPKGGVTIQGRFFRGGRWIPAGIIATAKPEEKAKLEGKKVEEASNLKAPVSAVALSTLITTGGVTIVRRVITLQLATAHAPADGITIGGKRFEGGQWIPDNKLAKATPKQKAKLVMKPDLFDEAAKTASAEPPLAVVLPAPIAVAPEEPPSDPGSLLARAKAAIAKGIMLPGSVLEATGLTNPPWPAGAHHLEGSSPGGVREHVVFQVHGAGVTITKLGHWSKTEHTVTRERARELYREMVERGYKQQGIQP